MNNPITNLSILQSFSQFTLLLEPNALSYIKQTATKTLRRTHPPRISAKKRSIKYVDIDNDDNDDDDGYDSEEEDRQNDALKALLADWIAAIRTRGLKSNVITKEMVKLNINTYIFNKLEISIFNTFDLMNILPNFVFQIEDAIVGLARRDTTSSNSYFQLIPALSHPHYHYNLSLKSFSALPSSPAPALLALPQSKSNLYIERYNILHQRILHEPPFAPPIVSSSVHFPLFTIESLSGTSQHNSRTILAMIRTQKEGGFGLEDPTGRLALSLSPDFEQDNGFYCDHTFVLADGRLIEADGAESGREERFLVNSMGLPPIESRETTLKIHPSLEMQKYELVIGSNSSREECKAVVHERLSSREEDMILILSSVHLDSPSVLQRIDTLFSAMNDNPTPPPLIVMLGPFLSQITPTYRQSLILAFDSLADLVVKYNNLAKKSEWVFIAGINEPIGVNEVLPCQGIPKSFTQKLRFRHLTMLKPRMTAHCAEDFPSDLTPSAVPLAPTPLDHYLLTILSQAHLSPLPLTQTAIYWQYDSCLQLYPLPSFLCLIDDGIGEFVVKDVSETKNVRCKGTTVAGSGSFSKDGSFLVYWPAKNEVEPSKV